MTNDELRYIIAKLSDTNAAIAQPVERILGKDEVASSNLASSSRKKHLRKQVLFSTKFALRASEIAAL